MTAGHLDLGKTWDAIHDGVAKLNPQAQEVMENGISQVNAMAGIDVRKGLLGSLGDEWVSYTSPNVGGSGMLGTATVNPLKDPVKAEQSLTAVETALTNIAAQQIRRCQCGWRLNK